MERSNDSQMRNAIQIDWFFWAICYLIGNNKQISLATYLNGCVFDTSFPLYGNWTRKLTTAIYFPLIQGLEHIIPYVLHSLHGRKRCVVIIVHYNKWSKWTWRYIEISPNLLYEVTLCLYNKPRIYIHGTYNCHWFVKKNVVWLR